MYVIITKVTMEPRSKLFKLALLGKL